MSMAQALVHQSVHVREIPLILQKRLFQPSIDKCFTGIPGQPRHHLQHPNTRLALSDPQTLREAGGSLDMEDIAEPLLR